jgi:TolA-binding protein
LAQTAFNDAPEEKITAPPGTDLSTLAAEVSRIDAARRASASGDYDESIRLLERYHQDFPKGALAPDADVVVLEALAAKGDKAEVARRAALVLSRYLGDPHAARVRWLAEH